MASLAGSSQLLCAACQDGLHAPCMSCTAHTLAETVQPSLLRCLLTHTPCTAGACSSKYAFAQGGQARRGPLEVAVHDVPSGAVQRHTLPAGHHYHPKLAWSACARYVSTSSESETVYVLHVVSGAVNQLTTWQGAFAWHPRASWLLTVSQQLALQVFAFEAGEPCCMAQLQLSPVFGSVLTAGASFALGATSDGTRVVVAALKNDGLNKPTWPVAVTQIAPSCAVLGHCLLRGNLPDAIFLSLCMGISVCAACASQFCEGWVHVIALDGPQVGRVLWRVQGVGPALSPCGGFLAIVSCGTGFQDGVEVLKLQASKEEVAAWAVDGWLGVASSGDCELGDMHLHQLTWLARPR